MDKGNKEEARDGKLAAFSDLVLADRLCHKEDEERGKSRTLNRSDSRDKCKGRPYPGLEQQHVARVHRESVGGSSATQGWKNLKLTVP